MANDVAGRNIDVGDYVFWNMVIYEVLESRKRSVDAISVDKISTTTLKTIFGNECCWIPKEDYLIWALKNK